MPFAALDHGCQDQYFPSRERLLDEFQDLIIRVFDHFLTRIVRKSLTGTGIQQAQKIIYFSHCTNR